MNVSVFWSYSLSLLLCVMLFEKGNTQSDSGNSTGRSIKCFACESKEAEQCSDTFQSNGAQVMNCTGSCVKSNNRYKKLVTYSRYCTQEPVADSCTKTEYDTGTHVKCFCSTSYCNAGTMAKPYRLGVLINIVLLCMGLRLTS